MPTPEDFPRRWFPLQMLVENSQSQALWNCKKRFVGVDAGRQSYKTELAKRKLVMSLIEPKPWDDPRYFFGAPTYKQARLIAWDDLKALVPRRWVRDWDRDVSETDLTIRTGFGSELHVVGMDKPERIEGKTWDGGVLDECSDLKWKEAERAIFPMIASRTGWLWRIGVPKRSGVGAAEFRGFCQDARKGKDPDSAAFTWPSSDVMTEEQLRWYQENWDIKDYSEQLGGDWQEGGGILFHAYRKEYNVRSCNFDREAAMVIGCDFNVDPMAWVLGHPRDGGRYMEWFDEIWLRNTNTPAALDVLWERYGSRTRGTMKFYGDATGRSRKSSAAMSDYQHISSDERFRKKGATVHFPKGNPPVKDRIAASNAVLCNAAGNVRCLIDPRVEHLISDLENQGMKPGTSEPDDSKGDVGHAGAAWGYPTYLLFPIEVNTGIPKIVITSGTNGKNITSGRRRYAAHR